MLLMNECQLLPIHLPPSRRPIPWRNQSHHEQHPLVRHQRLRNLSLDLELLEVLILLGQSHFLYLLPVLRVQHLERFNGFRSTQRNLFTFIETLAREISLQREDFFLWSPAALDPVAPSGFVFGLSFFFPLLPPILRV